MKKRVLCVAALLPVLASAAQLPQAVPVEIKALETTDETPFDTLGFQLFRGGFRCDGSGNVFFVPSIRGLGRTPASIVRASTNGPSSTKWNLSSILRTPDADVLVIGVATDSRGNIHALLDIRNHESARQVIASFDERGNVKAQVELNSQEIVADRFAVFDTGDFLLLGGQKGSPQPRLAVMASDGGALRDVRNPAAGPKASWILVKKLIFMEPANDGNVYFTPEDGPAYAISPAAEVIGMIGLASPQDGASLFDLKISGRRLAALYNIEDSQPMLRWISVYDLDTRNRVAAYGPVQNIVMCYQADGANDRFSLLTVKGGRKFVANASPR